MGIIQQTDRSLNGLSGRELFLRLFANAGGYGIGSFLIRFASFLLLPLYWQRLDPIDYGIIGVSQIVIVFLAPVFGLGLSHVVQRFYFDWDDKKRSHHLGCLWLSSLVFGLTLVVLLEGLGSYFSAGVIRSVPYQPYLRLTLLSSFAESFSLIPLTLIRLREEVFHYNRITFFSFLSRELLVLACVFGFSLRAEGYLLGILINHFLWAIYYGSWMLRVVRLPTGWREFGTFFKYAWPFVPTGILDGTFTISDRFILDKWVNLTQIGVYGVAQQLGSVVNLCHQILKTAWHPFIFRVQSERKDAAEVLAKFSVYYLLVMSVPALAIATLSPEFITIAASEKYQYVAPLVPFFAFAFWVQGFGESLGRGLDFSRRTIFGPLAPLGATIVSILLLLIFVPRWGIIGAVTAQCFAFAARSLIQTALASYFYPRPTPWYRLLGMSALLWGGYLAISTVHVQNPWMAVASKISLLVVLYVFIGLALFGNEVLVLFNIVRKRYAAESI